MRRFHFKKKLNIFQCRWLILPNNCELNLVCSLGTRKQEGRVGDLDLISASQNQKCSNFDFLRVIGYKGAMDAVYCGDEKLSLKVGPQNTLVTFLSADFSTVFSIDKKC